MHNDFFYGLEAAEQGTVIDAGTLLAQLVFNEQGLIPVVTQCAAHGDVLMLAWMNAEAVQQTLMTGRVTYWSRSRQQFWVKGESSGHTQALVELRVDCDGDTLLCRVNQTGPACHTGRDSCFYFSTAGGDAPFSVIASRPDSAS